MVIYLNFELLKVRIIYCTDFWSKEILNRSFNIYVN